MKKMYVFFGIMFLMASLAQTGWAVGPATGTPELYEMTFTQLTMVKQDGTVVVVNNTPATVDLADVDPNTFIGQVMGGDLVPGTYTGLNSTVSMDITIKGAVMVGSVIFYTTANVVPVPDPGNDPNIPDGTGSVAGEYDTMTGVAYPDVQAWYDAGAPIQMGEPAYAAATIHPPTTDATLTTHIGGEVDTIVEGQVVEETMEIDVTGSIQLITIGMDNILFPGAPTIAFID